MNHYIFVFGKYRPWEKSKEKKMLFNQASGYLGFSLSTFELDQKPNILYLNNIKIMFSKNIEISDCRQNPVNLFINI